MKKIKFTFFSIILLVLTLGLGISCQLQNSKDEIYAASTSTASYNILSYVSIISDSKVLTSSNVTTVSGTSISVMVNGATTISLNPFTTRYSSLSSENSTYFTENVKTIQVSKTRNMSFQYNNSTIYCEKRVTSDIYQTSYYYFADNLTTPSYSMTTLNTCLISYTETDNYVIFYIIDSYSLLVDKEFETANFEFSIYTSSSSTASETLTISFLKPVVRFANGENSLVTFETYKDFDVDTNSYTYYEKDTLLQSEQTFNKICLTFLNDTYEYTELNPLYFDINFNGFEYSFKFYSEEIDGENCLVVSYTDSVTGNTEQLATDYLVLLDDDDQEYTVFIQKVLSNEQFSITFTYRGRYAIEFYDNTYLENIPHPNYYSTSFYLKNDSTSDTDVDSKFNDIYILAQTVDDDGEPIEYIVSKATLNESVTVTIKNLNDFGDSLVLSDIIDRIEVTVTEFGNSGGNHPVTTTYYPLTEENQFDENINFITDLFSISDDGDYYLTCTEDAIYRVEIFAKNEKYDEYGDSYYDSVYYQFTIVKKIKATFKPDVDDDSVDSTHTASVPYTTETIYYENKIQNSDPIQFEVAYNQVAPQSSKKVLDITYKNVYKIMYGMQTVDISSATDEDNTYITFTFKGVGDMTVYITYEGVESVYTFNSEEKDNTITFSEYGTYTVTLIDSMGTTPTEVYTVSFEKELNTSSIIFIVLVSLIALAIVAFIIIVRGRVRTR